MPKIADNTSSHTICVIVSDSLSHDTVSVHLYQEHLIQFIMRRRMELLAHKEELQASDNDPFSYKRCMYIIKMDNFDYKAGRRRRVYASVIQKRKCPHR
jgi:hypothetical protein